MGNRAAILYGVHDIRLEDIPTPAPGLHEVLVRVTSVGVCGSDVHYYEHGRIGPYIVERPLILGHETAGVVVELGEKVTRHSVGDRVALEPGVPCGRCRECRSGRYNLCPDVRFFATPPIDGTFARFVTINEDFAFTLPDSVSDDEGALIEPLSVGVNACRRAGISAGDRVLVTGAGTIGNLAAQAAVVSGASLVVITDINDRRLGAAAVHPAIKPVNIRETTLSATVPEVDAFIECSGVAGVLAAGLAMLRPHGVAVAVGMSAANEMVLDLTTIQAGELWLTGNFRYVNTYPTAIALVAGGRVQLGSLVSRHYPLEEAEQALKATRSDPENIKSIVSVGASI
jgi:L-iditol 2-dehydrogenase